MVGGLAECLAVRALIVSHDRTFLDHTVTRILDMDIQQHRTREYAGNYTAYLEQRQVEIEKTMVGI